MQGLHQKEQIKYSSATSALQQRKDLIFMFYHAYNDTFLPFHFPFYSLPMTRRFYLRCNGNVSMVKSVLLFFLEKDGFFRNKVNKATKRTKNIDTSNQY